MRIDRSPHLYRKGVAGIVAALILFVMIFTVGTGYFLWVNTNNTIYSHAQANRAQADQLKQNENLLVTASCCSLGNLSFTAQNEGGIPVALVAVFVNDASGNIFSKTISTNLSPGTMNSIPIQTDCNPATTCKISTASVTVLTQRGSLFSGSYPPTSLTSAINAQVAAAIGDIQIRFQTYGYYTLTQSSCPSASGSSGWCFSSTSPMGTPAFAISDSIATSGNLAFVIDIVNLSPSKSTIVLDPFTFTEQFWGFGSSFREAPFFIVSNSSRDILSYYTPISLPYNKTTPLVFSASSCVLISSTNPSGDSCGTFSPQSLKGSIAPPAGSIAFISIFVHGWKAMTVPPYDVTKTNYGQNIPFVTTLYY